MIMLDSDGEAPEVTFALYVYTLKRPAVYGTSTHTLNSEDSPANDDPSMNSLEI